LKILRSPAGNKLARPASEYDDDNDEDKDEESHTTTTLGSYEEDNFLTKEDVSSEDRRPSKAKTSTLKRNGLNLIEMML
jgi:hypothetical protein